MSAETKAAIEDAIRAHIADERPGDIVTSWLVVTSSAITDEPGEQTRYWVENSPGPLHSVTGLVELGRRYIDDMWSGEDE